MIHPNFQFFYSRASTVSCTIVFFSAFNQTLMSEVLKVIAFSEQKVAEIRLVLFFLIQQYETSIVFHSHRSLPMPSFALSDTKYIQ